MDLGQPELTAEEWDGFDDQRMWFKPELPATTKESKYDAASDPITPSQGGKVSFFFQPRLFPYGVLRPLALPVFVSGVITSCFFVCASGGSPSGYHVSQ
jgi:hypothetical protein